MALRDETVSWQFLGGQLVLWLAYGAALMMPWIGEYPISVMVPRKLVIVGTAIMASALLRETYVRLLPPTAGAKSTFALAAIASTIVGTTWSGATSLLLGTSSKELWAFGFLDGGVPRFGAPMYEILLLWGWSLVYLVVRSRSHIRALRASATPPLTAISEELWVARDGTRALVAGAGEIDWVQASGDYVRVHTAGRSMLLRGTMTAYEAALGAAYVRIHRSTIVNVARVRELVARPNKEFIVVLRDGTKLRASRSYSERLKQAIGITVR